MHQQRGWPSQDTISFPLSSSGKSIAGQVRCSKCLHPPHESWADLISLEHRAGCYLFFSWLALYLPLILLAWDLIIELNIALKLFFLKLMAKLLQAGNDRGTEPKSRNQSSKDMTQTWRRRYSNSTTQALSHKVNWLQCNSVLTCLLHGWWAHTAAVLWDPWWIDRGEENTVSRKV